MCVGGEDDKVVLRSVECFNPTNSSWCHLKSLPQAVSKAGLVITGDNFMYLCGGEFPDGSAVRQVYRYDPVLDEWRELAQLLVARSEVGKCLIKFMCQVSILVKGSVACIPQQSFFGKIST